MSRDLELYLENVAESCRRIIAYTRGMSFARFAADERTIDAVARNLEIVGEAVKHLPPEIRSNHPQIEWRKIAGLRDMLIQGYFGIDVEIIWDVVTNKIPALRAAIDEIRLTSRS